MAEPSQRGERALALVSGVVAALLLLVFAYEGVRSVGASQPFGRLRIAERGRAPSPHLSIEHASVTPYPTATGEALILRGWLHNDATSPQAMPKLRLTLLDQAGSHGAQIVARTPPGICALAQALGQSDDVALAGLLVADAQQGGPVPAHGRRPLFAVLPGYERSRGAAWVTLDWLP